MAPTWHFSRSNMAFGWWDSMKFQLRSVPSRYVTIAPFEQSSNPSSLEKVCFMNFDNPLYVVRVCIDPQTSNIETTIHS